MHTQHSHKPASFHLSPQDAMGAPREDFLYVVCTRAGTDVDAPDFLAVVDTNPASENYGRIVHELPMPYVGDELHHFGWNRCSGACHGPDRSHLIVPGFRSSRVYVVDVGSDPRQPRIERVIEPEELLEETGYTRPHTDALHAGREHRALDARRRGRATPPAASRSSTARRSR